MAKKSDKLASASGAGTGMQSGTLAGEHANAAEAPSDPLAGKSEEARKTALDEARKQDEAAKKPARSKDEERARADEMLKAKAARRARGLVIDPDMKSAALALMQKLAVAGAAVVAAREKRAFSQDLAGAQAAVDVARKRRAALKKELSDLYGRAPDSVQAAETEVAAGQ